MTEVSDAALLIDGEDPETDDMHDVAHWISIYDQLVEYKHRLLKSVRAEHAALPSDAQARIVEDFVFLEDELARFEARRAFWLRRQLDGRGMHLDGDSSTALVGARRIALTKREFQLMRALLHRQGQYTGPHQLLASAWPDAQLTADQLRLYVGRLRAKLHGTDATILNRARRGYALVVAPAPAS